MKPRYDELSLPISITITDGERIFRWGRTHRSHERFTRPKWDPSWRYPSSADCTTATNDGLPERARIKPCRYWLSDFLVRRVLAHVRITANLVHQIQAGSARPSTFAVHLEEIPSTLGLLRISGRQHLPVMFVAKRVEFLAGQGGRHTSLR